MLVEAETAILARISESMTRLFTDPDAVSVESGPGEWDGAYLTSLISFLPAIRVAFNGATVAPETSLTLRPAEWTIFVVTGWDCETELQRRNGPLGSYRMIACMMADLHEFVLMHDTDRIGFVRCRSIDNLWHGSFDRAAVMVNSVSIAVDLPIDIVHPGSLDEFLLSGVDWTIRDPAVADLSEIINMRIHNAAD